MEPERESFVQVEPQNDRHSNSDRQSNSDKWDCLGTRVPKTEIQFFVQMILVYICVIVSIVNLSLRNGSSELWISLLSSCLGYCLPAPKIKK